MNPWQTVEHVAEAGSNADSPALATAFLRTDGKRSE
jgi:hypothetical protein